MERAASAPLLLAVTLFSLNMKSSSRRLALGLAVLSLASGLWWSSTRAPHAPNEPVGQRVTGAGAAAEVEVTDSANVHAFTASGATAGPVRALEPDGLTAEERGSIAGQILATRDWFVTSVRRDGTVALVATSPGQAFDFVAGAREVSVVPTGEQHGRWSWTMRPTDAKSVIPDHDKQRLTYARGAGVTEWFKNSRDGVEHGFTFASATADAVRSATVVVESSLQPVLRAGRDGVDFVDATGVAQLRYDGLYAFDASGRELPAWIDLKAEAGAHAMTLAVDTTGARFPVVIDPVIALGAATIRATPDEVADGFGSRIDQSGDLLVAGAPGRNAGANLTSGAAFVFKRDAVNPAGWAQTAMILPALPEFANDFGRAVAVGGSTVAVGGVRNGLAGGPVNEVKLYGIAASGALTGEVVTITTPTPSPTDTFGQAVDLTADGNTLVVGAPGALFNGSGANTGRVYIYQRNQGGAGAWGLVATLQPPTAVAGARFGEVLSVSGTLLAVGAPGQGTGRAFIYVLEGGGWTLDEEFAPPAVTGTDTVVGFASSIAAHGAWVAIGAPDSRTSGRTGAGRVIVARRGAFYDSAFQSTIYLWTSGSLLPAPPTSTATDFAGAGFGRSVSITDGSLVVGSDSDLSLYRPVNVPDIDASKRWAPDGRLNAVALDLIAPMDFGGGGLVFGPPGLPVGLSAVAATPGGVFAAAKDFRKIVYVRRAATNWPARYQFTAGPEGGDAGWVLARDGDLLAVGAPHTTNNSGAVYVFRRNDAADPGSEWTLVWTRADAFLPGAKIGTSLALKDDLLLIGEPGLGTGQVQVFKRGNLAATSWTLRTTLAPGSANSPAAFGTAVAFDGVFAAVGDPAANGGRGAMSVFQRQATGDWPVVMGGTAADPYRGYGASLAMTESHSIIVGAPGTPDDFVIGTSDVGAAFVWRYEPAVALPLNPSTWYPAWAVEQVLRPEGPSSAVSGLRFGESVALRSQWALVGAPGYGTARATGAAYAFRRDYAQEPPAGTFTTPDLPPWRQTDVILPPPEWDAGVSRFGRSVSLDGAYAAIGAPGTAATGGQAFLFLQPPGSATWQPVARMVNPFGATGDNFGTSVLLSGDELVVGSTTAGAFLFEQQRSQWRLWRADPEGGTASELALGTDVAIDGDWLVVSAPRHPLTYTPSTGAVVPESVRTGFTVHVMHRRADEGAAGAWEARSIFGIYGYGPTIIDQKYKRHGVSVDISGRHVIVGWTSSAPNDDGGALIYQITADGTNEYVVTPTNEIGIRSDGLTLSTAWSFGSDVAISGDYAVVSAPARWNENRTQTIIGGVARVYRRIGWWRTGVSFTQSKEWVPVKDIIVEDFAFGGAIALDGTRLVVSAPAGYDPESGERVGAVYLYERDQGGVTEGWGLVKAFGDPGAYADESINYGFGSSLALDGDTLIVGVHGDTYGGDAYGTGGSARIFERNAGGFNNWGRTAILSVGGDHVGTSVAISGSFVAVSGHGGEFTAFDEDGFPDGERDEPGAVAIFHRDAQANGSVESIDGRWGRVAKFGPVVADRVHTWRYGHALALDGTTLAVGAPGERIWHFEPNGDSRTDVTDRVTPGRVFVYDLVVDATQFATNLSLPDTLSTAGLDPTNYGGLVNTAGLDFDGDGLNNALEQFHGLDPLLADVPPGGATMASIDVATGDVVLRWREALDSGMSGAPQWSRDLGQWYGSGAGPGVGDVKNFTISIVAGGDGYVTKEARVPRGTETTLFLRLLVTSN